jgi:hypothetical protein
MNGLPPRAFGWGGRWPYSFSPGFVRSFAQGSFSGCPALGDETEGRLMSEETMTRLRIAALIYPMAGAIIFGVGIVLALTVPALNADAGFWIVVVVLTSIILSAPIAWMIAPRLRARYWRQRAEAEHVRR